MAKPFNLTQATRIAVQRAGKVAKLAFIKTDETLKEWAIGEARDLSEELVAYHEECRTTINQMVALNGGVPAKDRTRINAAQGALLKQLRELHGEEFDFVGGYYNNPVYNADDLDEDGNVIEDEDGNSPDPESYEAIWAATRTK